AGHEHVIRVGRWPDVQRALAHLEAQQASAGDEELTLFRPTRRRLQPGGRRDDLEMRLLREAERQATVNQRDLGAARGLGKSKSTEGHHADAAAVAQGELGITRPAPDLRTG